MTPQSADTLSSSDAGPTAFAVTAGGDLALKADRTGATTFTVTNLTGRPLRVRLQPKATPPGQDAWYTLAGESEVPMAIGATITVDVRATVPADVAAGQQSMHLRAVDEADPEVVTDGQAVAVTIPAAVLPQPKRKTWLWLLIGALVLLLLGGGAVAWFVTRPKTAQTSAPQSLIPLVVSGTPVTGGSLSVVGASFSDATAIEWSWLRCAPAGSGCAPIAGAAAATYTIVDADLGQSIQARASATGPGGTTSVTSPSVGPVQQGFVLVSNVKQETLSTATKLLADDGLKIQVSNDANPGSCSVVLTQSPGTYSKVARGSTVQVTVQHVDQKNCLFIATFQVTKIALPTKG